MTQPENTVQADIDYLAVLQALRWLVATGRISEEIGRKTASRVARQIGANLLIV